MCVNRNDRNTLVCFVAATFALWSGTAAAEQNYDCQTDSHVVDQCFSVHGRLTREANSRLTLWPVGTKRLLGVQYPGDMPEVGGQLLRLPAPLQQLIEQNMAVTGDFLVCPFTHQKPGTKQYVCIAEASNLKSGPQ